MSISISDLRQSVQGALGILYRASCYGVATPVDKMNLDALGVAKAEPIFMP